MELEVTCRCEDSACSPGVFLCVICSPGVRAVEVPRISSLTKQASQERIVSLLKLLKPNVWVGDPESCFHISLHATLPNTQYRLCPCGAGALAAWAPQPILLPSVSGKQQFQFPVPCFLFDLIAVLLRLLSGESLSFGSPFNIDCDVS